MKFYFLSNTNMSKKAGLITTVAISTVLAVVAPVNAEKSQVNLNFSKETQQPVCKTTLECEELATSLESQIHEIEQSNELDFDKLDNLQKQLIEVQRQLTAQAKQRNAEAKQRNAEAKQRTAEAKQRNAELREQIRKNNEQIKEMLDSIKGSLK